MGRTIIGIPFEWDDEKDKSNKKKHGLSFATAVKAFNDDCRVEIYDEFHSQDEDRFIVIGLAEDIVFLVYTIREETCRIISARLATTEERRLYYGNNKNNS